MLYPNLLHESCPIFFFFSKTYLETDYLLDLFKDVLIPWHRPAPGSSDPDDKHGSSAVGDTTTTTCTSEDDVTHYHAYTQTGSDSEPLSMSRLVLGIFWF